MRLGLIQSMFIYRHPSLDSFMSELRRASLLAPCRDGAVAPPREAVRYTERTPSASAAPRQAQSERSAPEDSAPSDFIIEGDKLLKYVGKGSRPDVPEGVKVIGERAFANCAQLERVGLPSTLSFISPHAFSNCKRLLMVQIPRSVWGVGGYAFEGCDSLASAFLSRSTTLGSEAFPPHTDVTYI